jgi:hypothetical protein
MVLVKILVYHTLGTLMPYPLEDPPRLLEASLPDGRLFMLLAFIGLISLPVGREASIASQLARSDDGGNGGIGYKGQDFVGDIACQRIPALGSGQLRLVPSLWQRRVRCR